MAITKWNAVPNTLWRPKYFTPPKGGVTLGSIIPVLCKGLIAMRGFREGKPIILAAWQQWLLNSIMELDEEGLFRLKTVLIMIPRKNGKSFLAALIVLLHLLTAPGGAEIYSAAKNREQARILFSTIAFWINSNRDLKAILRVIDSKNKILNKRTGAFYKALSADSGGAQGLAPYVVVADEIHAWEAEHSSKRARDFWAALTKGSADRPESQIIGITTAGDSKSDSLLGDLYNRGVRAATGQADDPYFGFFCWEAEEDDDFFAENTWNRANPNLAEGLMSIASFKEALADAVNTSLNSFLRYHLNLWREVNTDRWISDSALADLISESALQPGERVVLGFDGSKNGDLTALVAIGVDSGIIQLIKVWKRPDDAASDWMTPKEEVWEAVKDVQDAYDLLVLWADAFLFEREIKIWSQSGIPVTAVPQSRERVSMNANQLRSDLIQQRFRIVYDEDLFKHFSNAVFSEYMGFSKERKSSKKKVDILAATVYAFGAWKHVRAIDSEFAEDDDM